MQPCWRTSGVRAQGALGVGVSVTAVHPEQMDWLTKHMVADCDDL